jgi:hypothetical protein
MDEAFRSEHSLSIDLLRISFNRLIYFYSLSDLNIDSNIAPIPLNGLFSKFGESHLPKYPPPIIENISTYL